LRHLAAEVSILTTHTEEVLQTNFSIIKEGLAPSPIALIVAMQAMHGRRMFLLCRMEAVPENNYLPITFLKK
jgi:hypothetical protein